jgi:hypothetical protein
VQYACYLPPTTPDCFLRRRLRTAALVARGATFACVCIFEGDLSEDGALPRAVLPEAEDAQRLRAA